jgi:hypothetical protein
MWPRALKQGEAMLRAALHIALCLTTGLCSAGTPTNVSGFGPWNWSCLGSSNGGSNAGCFAPSGTGGGGSLLPADRDASANWQMAGLLSVGGIPNRTTQCGATINPLEAVKTTRVIFKPLSTRVPQDK